jgi:hypothetical protein
MKILQARAKVDGTCGQLRERNLSRADDQLVRAKCFLIDETRRCSPRLVMEFERAPLKWNSLRFAWPPEVMVFEDQNMALMRILE